MLLLANILYIHYISIIIDPLMCSIHIILYNCFLKSVKRKRKEYTFVMFFYNYVITFMMVFVHAHSNYHLGSLVAALETTFSNFNKAGLQVTKYLSFCSPVKIFYLHFWTTALLNIEFLVDSLFIWELLKEYVVPLLSGLYCFCQDINC